MDFAAALAGIGQATGIVKTLRGIEKGYDLATVRAQMADVYSALADAKIALADAREELHERDRRIKELEDAGSKRAPGEACPYCGAYAMRMKSQGMNGQWEQWVCEECSQTKEIRHDLANKMQARR